MNRPLWLATIAGVGAIALLLALRGQAVASEGATSSAGCAPLETAAGGFVPAFCLNVPTTSVRRETTVPLRSLTTSRADVRAEDALAVSDTAALAGGIDRSVERVETLFGRSFSSRPRIILFATPASFATGANELFGYSAATAAYVAATYGGIFDRSTLTIAANWSASSGERMNAAIAHELTHLMIRDLTGGNEIPTWLDEGLATLVEQEDPSGVVWVADEALAGRALATSHAVSFASVSALSDWHSAFGTFGRPLYGFAAEAVREMRARVDTTGLVRILTDIGQGTRFAIAYLATAHESVDALEQRLSTGAAPTIVASDVDASGLVRWTLYAGPADDTIGVAISGDLGYRLAFTVRTDRFGTYRGSFRSPTSAESYTVRAAGAQVSLSATR
jgi:hypothetical protein